MASCMAVIHGLAVDFTVTPPSWPIAVGPFKDLVLEKAKEDLVSVTRFRLLVGKVDGGEELSDMRKMVTTEGNADLDFFVTPVAGAFTGPGACPSAASLRRLLPRSSSPAADACALDTPSQPCPCRRWLGPSSSARRWQR